MTRLRAWVVFALAVACPALAPAACEARAATRGGDLPDCDVTWRLAPRFDTVPRAIDVELSFAAGDRTRTPLELPGEWAGVDDYAAGIAGLAAPGAGQAIVDGARAGDKVVTHRARERVRVSYRVIAPFDAGRDERWRMPYHRDFYRLQLGGDWFHFFGHGVFVAPLPPQAGERIRACVTVTGLPRGAPIVTSLGRSRGPAATFRLHGDVESLRDTLWLGGAFSVTERRIAGRPVVVAQRGDWNFTPQALADTVVRIIARSRAFWRDPGQPYFVVGLIPNHEAAGNYGGTAVRRAFAMHAARDTAVPGGEIERLIAHEYLHTWIPRRFGSMGDEKEEPLHYWFSEGFTDFYTHRLALRATPESLETYARVLNARIAQLLTSPERNADNRRVQAEFFSDPRVGDLPYRRGEMLALRWDRMLRDGHRRNLDGVMHALLLPRAVEATAPSPRATARLLAALERPLGAQPRLDVERFVERGESFEFAATDLGPCFTMTLTERRTFALGFDRRSLDERKLSGVDPDGPAYAAGARDGQPVAGFDLHDGDITRDLTLKVMVDGVATPLVYRPLSRESIAVPAYAARTDAFADPACRAWLPR